MIRSFQLFLSLSILSLFGLFICSCEKDEDNNDDETYEFSVQFVDGYGRDYGWVVLHNGEGTAVSEYKKYVGDALVDFGEINSSKVTITCVMVDTSQTPFMTTAYDIDIASDYISPAGKWIFTGNNRSDESLGNADITMHFPNGNYSGFLLSQTEGTLSSSEVPGEPISLIRTVHRLEENNKYSMFGAVYAGKGGLCGWLLNQNFQLNQTNFYEFDLTQNLFNKTINANRPIAAARIYGCWNQRKSRLYVNLENNPNMTNDVAVSYPDTLPNTEWYLSLIASDPDGVSYYDKYYDKSSGLPDMVNIPEHSVTASYNETNKEIYNIQIAGTPDHLCGYWTHIDMDNYIRWRIYSSITRTSLKQFVLPDEVIQEIGDKIDLLGIQYVGITDYNSTNSHDDIINRFFIQNVPVYERYEENHFFTHYLYSSKNKNINSATELYNFNEYDNFDR